MLKKNIYRVTILAFGIYLATLCVYFSSDAERKLFWISPYIQLGNEPAVREVESLTLIWYTPNSLTDQTWQIEYRPAGQPLWQTTTPHRATIAIETVPALVKYTALLERLSPGIAVEYRISLDTRPVFISQARTRKAAHQAYSFVLTGDIAVAQIAYRMYQCQPDFGVIVGDIAYYDGRIAEYRTYFGWHNHHWAIPAQGAPLMREVLYLAVPGNHDVDANLDRFPDLLGYFHFWDQPLNGPVPGDKIGQPRRNIPTLSGSPARQKAFLQAASKSYPQMANFSFDFGNSHWLMLDGNEYMDWTDPALLHWLEQDLAAHQNAVWRFVGVHQPPFHSGPSHRYEQRMRLLCHMFQKYKVDMVFSGHVHNYQRSHPFIFTVSPQPDGKLIAANGTVNGSWQLDKRFDGDQQTTPQGIIYVVSGGGGARMDCQELQGVPASWQEFTAHYESTVYSFTSCRVEKNKLVVRQISEYGKELDRFTIVK